MSPINILCTGEKFFWPVFGPKPIDFGSLSGGSKNSKKNSNFFWPEMNLPQGDCFLGPYLYWGKPGPNPGGFPDKFAFWGSPAPLVPGRVGVEHTVGTKVMGDKITGKTFTGKICEKFLDFGQIIFGKMIKIFLTCNQAVLGAMVLAPTPRPQPGL